jgi:hypothetical protein
VPSLAPHPREYAPCDLDELKRRRSHALDSLRALRNAEGVYHPELVHGDAEHDELRLLA